MMLNASEYLDAIDAQPNGVYVVHERIERKLPFHVHRKGQFTYVQGGIAYIYIENIKYVIPARHYVWIPRGLAHYLEVRHSVTITRNLYFYSNDDDKDTFYSKLGIYPVNNLLLEMIVFSERYNGMIEEGSDAFQFLASIKNILPQLGQETFPIALPTTNDERLRPIILYLAQNFHLQVTLELLSDKFGIGERTLSRLFQSVMSISFLQYLKLLRVVKAIEMMLQNKLSTSEIAYATGYNSLSSFSKAFYQVTNMRPSSLKFNL